MTNTHKKYQLNRSLEISNYSKKSIFEKCDIGQRKK